MFGKKTERITVLILSIAMLLSSTGLVPSFAAEVSTVSSTNSVSDSTTAEISSEGGSVTTVQVTQEGGSLATPEGDGTASNPYTISSAEDFLNMQSIINSTKSANKHFVLTTDIDLSDIKADDFKSNSIYGGSLVSVSKSLASSSNVGFTLDGKGHKLVGLNVESDCENALAIFGYINASSTVSNIVVESPVITSNADSVSAVAVVAAENDGTISNVTVNNPILTASASKTAGIVAAINNGTVINCTVKGKISNTGIATAAAHTISATGAVGAVAGYNNGKISSVTVLNVGAFIPAEGAVVYGALAGKSCGSVTDSVATGAVSGADDNSVAGGAVGQAIKPTEKEKSELRITNVYTLVSVSKSVRGNAVIGENGTAEMMQDCYWSSAISGKNTSADNYGTGINDLSYTIYRTVQLNKTIDIKSAELNLKWGKASFGAAENFRTGSKCIELTARTDCATVKGVTKDSLSNVTYNVNIMLPSDVGAGSSSVTLTQPLKTVVIVLPQGAKGDGTEQSPIEISTAGEFSLLANIPYINCKLVSDITLAAGNAFEFCGTLDGDGHTLTVETPVFSAVYGSESHIANIKNLNVIVSDNISSAIFGSAVNVKLSGIKVSFAQDVKAQFNSGNVGVFLDSVKGASVIDDCHVAANIAVSGEKIASVAAFAGSVDGDNSVITNSGANVTVKYEDEKTDDEKVFDTVSGFIGSIDGENVNVSNCYVTGSVFAGKYAFIGKATGEKLTAENIIWSKGGEKAAQNPVDFENAVFDEEQFSTWSFDISEGAFFTGKGGKFVAELPEIKVLLNASADDFTVSCNTDEIVSSVSISDGKLILNVERADGSVTVRNSPVTVTNTTTGLSLSIKVSNGLDRDSKGNYIIASAYDLAYVSENINEYLSAGFVMTADVDMSEVGEFKPIGGTDAAFSGTFDGNGHTVSNLIVNGTSKAALFATLDSANIKNITFKNAYVTAQGSYAAVLAGQAVGKTVINNINIISSEVKSADLYSAALVGAVNSNDGAVISDITVSETSVVSSAGFVGAVSGRADGKAEFVNLKVDKVTVSGAQNVGGAFGCAEGEVKIENAQVAASKVSGISNVAGIAGYSGIGTSVSKVNLTDSSVSTVGNDSSYIAGGITASTGATISDVTVVNSTVFGGIAAGIAGRTVGDTIINNAAVSATKISAQGSGTVAAGILGVHNFAGTAKIINAKISADSEVVGAAVCAGIVGECFGENAYLSVENGTSLAKISGDMTATSISAAGILGKVGVGAVNNIKLVDVKASGEISSASAAGGIIGLIKNTDSGYNAENPIIDGCVCAVTFGDTTPDESGMIIGFVENKIINSDNISSAVKNSVISTAFSEFAAYSAQSGIVGAAYDMNNPNGNPIKISTDVLKSSDETEIAVGNLPEVSGFTFDASKGWISASEDRISVVRSEENSVTLKALRKSEVMIVAYYVSESDADFDVPVSFTVKAELRDKLNGQGTEAEPYLISNAYELEIVAQYAGDNAYFVLTDDIELTDADFVFGGGFNNVGNGIVTIGDEKQGFNGHFSGLYNGKVHTISGLRMKNNIFGGLFGALDSAVISDLIIDGASVEGEYYVGVLAGRADNSTISNVTVQNSTATSLQGGSFAGGLVGCGADVNIENVTVENTEVSATSYADVSTFEAVGGLGGKLCGSVNGATVNNVKLETVGAAGGLVGYVCGDESLVLSNAQMIADINADFAGGAVGKIDNPALIKISDISVGGNISGERYEAGIAAVVESASSDFDVSQLRTPMISNAVIGAKINGGNAAIVIGDASETVFTGKVNTYTDVFTNVYYSSYQNALPAFATGAINAYQSAEYLVNDLDNVKFIENGEKLSSVKLGGEYRRFADDSFTVGEFDGWKQLQIGGITLSLADVTSDVANLVDYNEQNSAIRIRSNVENANLEFVYDNGLTVALPIEADFKLDGAGTKENPYIVSNEQDFEIMQQSAIDGDAYFALSNDINLENINQSESFDAHLDGKGFVLYGYSGAALFGTVSGTLENIGFAGFNITDSESKAVGAVAEVLDDATVKNCFVIADVEANSNNQDVGILAGRAENGTLIEGCLTSGKVVSANALAVGGIVGYADDTEIVNSESTAYVCGGKAVGGIVGEAVNSAVTGTVFANMAETSNGAAANIAGKADNTQINNVYFDLSASVSDKFASATTATASYALTTEQLIKSNINGFVSTGEYPIPVGLVGENNSSAFNTGVKFATLAVKYLSGLNSGSANNYTEIKTATEVNGNEVSLVTLSEGYMLTLNPTVDFAESSNAVARYSNPASVSALSVSYKLVDNSADGIKDTVVSFNLRSGKGSVSNSFGLFTKIGEQPKQIADVAVADGVFYVALTADVKRNYTVSAIDENGTALSVTESGGEFAVEVGSAKSVSLSVTVGDKVELPWGLRSIWRSITDK